MRSYFDPILKLDVLLKYVCGDNTCYWFNTYLVVRSNEAEAVGRAKQLEIHRAWTCALQSVPRAGSAALVVLQGCQKKPEVKCIH